MGISSEESVIKFFYRAVSENVTLLVWGLQYNLEMKSGGDSRTWLRPGLPLRENSSLPTNFDYTFISQVKVRTDQLEMKIEKLLAQSKYFVIVLTS